MDKINLYVVDTRKHTFSELLSYTKISDEDLKTLDKFRVLEVKKEKLASLYFKRKYVGEFSINEDGKPVSKNLFFNISHSKGVVVIAISKEHEIGVDIEVIKSKDEDLVKYVSSEEEYKFIKTEFDFLSIWTNKESLVKCLGTGIKSDIKSIPALPLNGKKEFKGETYFSKITKVNDSIISITIKDKNDFDFDLVMEEVHYD